MCRQRTTASYLFQSSVSRDKGALMFLFLLLFPENAHKPTEEDKHPNRVCLASCLVTSFRLKWRPLHDLQPRGKWTWESTAYPHSFTFTAAVTVPTSKPCLQNPPQRGMVYVNVLWVVARFDIKCVSALSVRGCDAGLQDAASFLWDYCLFTSKIKTHQMSLGANVNAALCTFLQCNWILRLFIALMSVMLEANTSPWKNSFIFDTHSEELSSNYGHSEAVTLRT